jgi:hypothetical protein
MTPPLSLRTPAQIFHQTSTQEYNIPLTASGTKDLELLSEKGMVRIEKF